MKQIIYVSDRMNQSADFINSLLSDLQKLGIKNIQHDREHNLITVGDMEVRGISIHENCLCVKIHDTEYFIDGIDMKNYKGASKERLDWLIYHVQETIMCLEIGAKQLNGKEELIKILTEG